MADKRNNQRQNKRLTLRFGIDSPVRMAFTEDVSPTGLFIKTTNICPPGSKIVVEFSPDKSSTVRLTCRVMWAKKVPPQLIHMVRKSGMGVRILQIQEGSEVFQVFCRELADNG